MLIQSRSFSTKRLSQLAMVAVLSVLTACGGGGGGGGSKKSIPTTVNVIYPTSGSIVADGSQDFEVQQIAGTNQSGLLITLNGTDVTSLFAAGGSGVTASAYSLAGLLVEGTNYFNAQTSGSKVSGVQFTYNAKPVAILTALQDCSAGVCTVAGETHKAQLAPADGVVLKDANSVVLVPALSTILEVAGFPGSQFSAAGITIPVPSTTASPSTNADFTIQLKDKGGETVSTALLVPKAVVKYGAAAQLNNSAFDVIESWLQTVVEQKFASVLNGFVATNLWNSPITQNSDLIESNYNTAASPELLKDFVSGAATNNACNLLNAARADAAQKFTQCILYVTKLTPEFKPNGIQLTAITSGSNVDNAFYAEATIALAKLDITLDTVGFGLDLYKGAFEVPLQYLNPTFKAVIKISKVDGKIINIALKDPSPFTANVGSLQAVDSTKTFCNICDAGKLASIQTVVAAAGSILNGQVVTKLEAETATINKALEKVSVANTSVYQFVKDSSDVVQNAVYFDFSGSAVNEAKNGSATVGGFIGIGGSTYADDKCPNDPKVTDCVQNSPLPGGLLAAPGSYFDALDTTASGSVNKNFFNATDDVILALSENSLNQLLLTAFQSKFFAYQAIDLKVSDLGELGNSIISLTAGSGRDVTAGDDVSVALDLQAVPYASFDTAGLELFLNKLTVKITLYRNCSISCTELYTSEFAMDAKMLIGLGLNGLVPNMPLVSVDDTSINIYGAVTNTFKDPLTPSNTINDAINKAIRDEVNTRLNAGTLAVLMGSQVKSLVEGFVADFNKPIEQNVDLKGLGLEQKSAELELTKLQMDTSGEFVQLSAKIKAIATPADPITSVFRLNVTDSCLSGGVAVVPAPMGCPGYVAP